MDDQGNNVDHRFVVRRPIDQIRSDVESGLLNPLVRDAISNQNLLHVAVSQNNFEIIQYLGTEWGGDAKELVCAVDRYGQTPLHIACSVATPNLEVVKYLLDVFLAYQVVIAWSTNSPLHIAIRKDNIDVVKLLVSRAVLGWAHPLSFLEKRDCNGLTPLMFACTCTQNTGSHSAVVQYLVHCERPNKLHSQIWQPRDNTGRTALHLACASHTRLEQVIELVKNYNHDVEVQDNTNMRPLHVAVASASRQYASAASLSVVRFLVTQAGADVNAKDGKGWSPLHYACQDKNSRNTELIRLLVENGAETLAGDKIGRTPLHLAVMSENHDLISHLVEKEGTAVDSRDNEGNTPLHLACSLASFTVASYLLRQHADADAENFHKQRPIHIACTNLRSHFISLLLENGANANAADRYQQTPLHKACMSNVGQANHPDGSTVVRSLLNKGANVDLRDEDFKTPLLYAVSRDNIERARLLLSFGANTLCKDKSQNNVLHVARSADIARLLIEDDSPSALARGVAHTLLTATNSKGEKPIDIVRRRVWDGGYTDDRKLLHYIRSFTDRQVAVVPPPESMENKTKRKRFEACSQLNPHLTAFQLYYVARICSLLTCSKLAEDLKFQVLGFLSPLDLMNG